MKEIKTVLDLILLIDKKMKSGAINYETTVFSGTVSDGGSKTYFNNASAGVKQMSKNEYGRKVNRSGDAVFYIE